MFNYYMYISASFVYLQNKLQYMKLNVLTLSYPYMMHLSLFISFICIK